MIGGGLYEWKIERRPAVKKVFDDEDDDDEDDNARVRDGRIQG